MNFEKERIKNITLCSMILRQTQRTHWQYEFIRVVLPSIPEPWVLRRIESG